MLNSWRPIFYLVLTCGVVACGSSGGEGNKATLAPPPISPPDKKKVQLKLVAPIEVNVEADRAVTQVVLGKATPEGGEKPVVIVNNAPVSGFPVGTTVVIWTATDTASVIVTASQTVVVNDTTAPLLTPPPNIQVAATGSTTVIDIGLPKASDRVDPNPTVTHNAPSTGFAIGTTIVTWTATDARNNSATATQTVVVESSIFGDTCAEAQALYSNTVKNDLDAHSCFGCHILGGVAGHTNIVFDRGDDSVSLDTFRNYLANGFDVTALLNKTLGIPSHTGGNLFGSNASSEYKNLANLLSLLAQCNVTVKPDPEPNGNTLLSKVSLQSRTTTLRRASIILAGRIPDETDYSRVTDDASLRVALRSLMAGEGFIDFIYRSGNEWFLTRNLNFDGYFTRTGVYTETQAAALDSVETETIFKALRQEPLELLRFITDNDRPFTEVVTANYTLANNDLAKLYMAAEIGLSGATTSGWRPVKYPFASDHNTSTSYPHAGVLSTAAWLTRFPTTATNRNRHRVNAMYQQFLGVDIEATAARPIDDPDGIGNVPVMDDSHCTVCHSYLDPAAGAFMDFAGDGEINGRIYRHFGDHSLTKDYTSGADYPPNRSGDAWYKPGDIWYRDLFEPGFEGVPMPGGIQGFTSSQSGNGGTSALSWVTHELVKDPRFAKAGVYFWFETLYGRKPLKAPIIETEANYTRDLNAFRFEDQLIDKLAAGFSSRGYVVRGLLVEMVMNPLFRANSVSENLSADEQHILANIGVGRLLSAPEINNLSKNMLKDSFSSDVFNTIFTGLGYIHDGFDGISSAQRNRQPTSITQWAVDNRISQLVCQNDTLIRQDFIKPAINRLFVPHVEPEDIPGTALEDLRIRQNIQYLHRYVLGDDLTIDDPSINRTYNLFAELLANSVEETSVGVVCDGTQFYRNGLKLRKPYPDNFGTYRAWNTVLVYLLTDLKYLAN